MIKKIASCNSFSIVTDRKSTQICSMSKWMLPELQLGKYFIHILEVKIVYVNLFTFNIYMFSSQDIHMIGEHVNDVYLSGFSDQILRFVLFL